MTVIEVYTDGACSGNPGPGGWGAVIRHVKEDPKAPHEDQFLSGGEAETTNNRMEMMAAIASLESLPKGSTVHLYTDSKYLKDGITLWIANWKKNGWITASKTPVKNRDLWQRLEKILALHSVEWHWVKGHSGHKENEKADALARNAIIAQRMNEPVQANKIMESMEPK